ncbi:hypothetical protein H9X57_04695 [Flavobacterium piscinae]|uniref:hypothetical protein n=1 Tax=Flavobacterium piscinae TaxID=2506424 RepID=UPI0019C218FF|nr:hypothetical protein [Flavobacterium piscinae]MBC8882934.1 hypothetical protein [Flavobacterium piscinae]
MRILLIFFLLLHFSANAQIINAQHCGYDFTSYLVIDVHEKGKKKTLRTYGSQL